MRNVHSYGLLCGNFDCATRFEVQADGEIGRRFTVFDDDLTDGEVWMCDVCKSRCTSPAPDQTAVS